jgi:hypothetical protein
MICVRELTDEEIKEVANSYTMGEWPSDFCAVQFARALFEAARVQQTQEREVQRCKL